MLLLELLGLPALPVEIGGDVGFEVDIFKVLNLTLRLVAQTIQEDGGGSFVIFVVLRAQASVVH